MVRRDDHARDVGATADRDPPVVADDEVVPELSVLPEQPRHVATSGTADVLRTSVTMPNAVTTTNAMTPRRDASAPGQVMPAPSALQKIPNDVSITPTPNFNVFSGTRVSGACTIIPAINTTTNAAPAPTAASPRFPCVPPNVTTMNATSRPSRNTPLNATVNAYQSWARRS